MRKQPTSVTFYGILIIKRFLLNNFGMEREGILKNTFRRLLNVFVGIFSNILVDYSIITT